MNNQEKKLNDVKNAYTSKKRGEEEIYILNENLDKQTYKDLLDIQFHFSENIGSIDLCYEIMATACQALSNIETIEKLKVIDILELSSDKASVYTSIRLSYLNNLNQSYISEVMKGNELNDIAEACAVYYEDLVYSALVELQAYILDVKTNEIIK